MRFYKLILLLLFLPVLTVAQQFKGGITGALNITQIEGDTKAGYDHAGLKTGLFVEYRFNKRFATSLGLNYDQRGANGKAIFPNQTKTMEYHADLDYIEVPLIFHVMDKDFVYAGVGLSYGTLIYSAEEDHSGNVEPYMNKVPFNENDFSYLFDLRMRLHKGLKLNVRYQRSLIPVRNRVLEKLDGTIEPSDQYPYGWSFGLIYIFNDKNLRPVDKRKPGDVE